MLGKTQENQVKTFIPYTQAVLERVKHANINRDIQAGIEHAQELVGLTHALTQHMTYDGLVDARDVKTFLDQLYQVLTRNRDAPRGAFRTVIPVEEWDRVTERVFPESSEPPGAASISRC